VPPEGNTPLWSGSLRRIKQALPKAAGAESIGIRTPRSPGFSTAGQTPILEEFMNSSVFRRAVSSPQALSLQAGEKTIDQLVGQQIRLRRTHCGLTQTGLGKRLGVSFQQVQKYETGANRVHSSTLYEMSLILKVPVEFFFSALPNPMREGAEMGPEWAGRLAYISTLEGQHLVDALRDLPVPVRASIVGMVRTLARIGGSSAGVPTRQAEEPIA
jgi:transcriptional regulator with XRE-family HTH domain